MKRIVKVPLWEKKAQNQTKKIRHKKKKKQKLSLQTITYKMEKQQGPTITQGTIFNNL